MSEWGTVVLTLGSALIGVFGALAGTLIQMRSARQDRRLADLHARRDKGAEAVGPVMSLIRDADPVQLFRPGYDPGDVLDRVDELRHRWAPLRDRLFVYGAAHPSGAVVTSTQRVAGSIDGFLVDLRIAAAGRGDVTIEGTQEMYPAVSLGVIGLTAEIRGEPLYFGPARDLEDG
jgi:hypothetical protein